MSHNTLKHNKKKHLMQLLDSGDLKQLFINISNQ